MSIVLFAKQRSHRFISIYKISAKIIGKMSTTTSSTINNFSDDYLVRAQCVVPPLSNSLYKGQAGRIGVIGGSFEYTGAPFFAAIAAMRVGADAVHIFCSKDAAIPIKSYSPELMVHPVLDDANDAVALIEPWLERLHVLIIGPGLGRETKTFDTIIRLLEVCKRIEKPLIIDADGLFLLSQNINLIADYPGVILTPNAVEFIRLFGNDGIGLAEKFKITGPNVTVLQKGFNDMIYSSTDGVNDYEQVSGGGGRRCSGQGDILAGTIAVFYYWAIKANDPNAAKVACYAGSYFLKKLNPYTFRSKGRSMCASDMIDKIHETFELYFENKQKK